MTSLFEPDDARTGGDRRAGEQIKTYVTVIALATSLVGLGYNLRRVDEVARTVEAVSPDRLDQRYVRKDVQDETLKLMAAQLEALRSQLNELKVAVEQRNLALRQ